MKRKIERNKSEELEQVKNMTEKRRGRKKAKKNGERKEKLMAT